MAKRRASILVVNEAGPAMEQFARALVETLGADAKRQQIEQAGHLVLAISPEGVELREPEMKPGRGMRIDLTTMDLRTGSGGLSRKQPIAKAFGPKVHTIADATAGTGQDAVLLAALGYRVTAIECSVVLQVMFEDALARAVRDESFSRAVDRRLAVRFGDSRDVLPTLDPPPDAVYIDPMFPPKKRASALPRKEIQMLRKLVGDDEDADELFAVAMETAKKRVVVKRPTHAPPLAGEPSMRCEGNLVRYDVYLR